MPSFGLYGTTYPVLIAGATTIYLNYAVVTRDEPEWEYVVHQSKMNGVRTISRKGAHHVIEMIYHLYKEGTLSQQHTKADQIQDLLWNDTSFYYYKFGDGVYYKDSSGNAVNFKLVEFYPFHLEDVTKKDAVKLKIISSTYVKVAPTQT